MQHQTPPVSGPWKEGRVSAVSLFYDLPDAESLLWVIEHHAAVGIRATWRRRPDEEETLLRSRAWDVRESVPEGVPPPRPAPPQPQELMDSVEKEVPLAGWSIWRFDSNALASMGREAHATLLRRLGDNHARLWCAPIRDVAAFAINSGKKISL